MEYLVLLYGDETVANEPGTAEFEAEMAGYIAFGEVAGPAIRGGAALHLTETARTIRHRGGEVTISDGPFAEVTEALGGYYVLEADDLDQVIEMVRLIPAATVPTDGEGGAEIRPLLRFGDLKGLDESQLGRTSLATLYGPMADGEAHRSFQASHADSVAVFGALEPGSAPTSVRVRDGQLEVSDGPVMPAIAVTGGFYLLDAGDSLEAVAGAIPVGDGGAVEIRPVMDLGDL